MIIIISLFALPFQSSRLLLGQMTPRPDHLTNRLFHQTQSSSSSGNNANSTLLFEDHEVFEAEVVEFNSIDDDAEDFSSSLLLNTTTAAVEPPLVQVEQFDSAIPNGGHQLAIVSVVTASELAQGTECKVLSSSRRGTVQSSIPSSMSSLRSFPPAHPLNLVIEPTACSRYVSHLYTLANSLMCVYVLS